MSSGLKLDDPTETVIFIPHAPDEDPEEETATEEENLFFENGLGDLTEGDELRWEAYRTAWTKCLAQVQEIVKAIYEPVILQVVENVLHAGEDDIRGLPHAEILTIVVTSPSPSPAFLQQVIDRLKKDEHKKPECYITHLYPPECSSFKSSGRTLAPYDIKVLDVWYRDFEEKQKYRPKLVVILHDFEQFDQAIMRDFMYICSLRSRTLPLVFIPCLSSSHYLHTTYPRSTIALLRIQQYSVPSGTPLMEKIVLGTFASPQFTPDLILGPDVLETIVDHFARYDSSLDSLITTLQLAHLKHFSIDPLTLLHHSTPSPSDLQADSSFPFLDMLLVRLHGAPEKDDEPLEDWQLKSITAVTKAVNTARRDFYLQAKQVVVAFRVFFLLQSFMDELRENGVEPEAKKKRHFPKNVRLFVNILKGTVPSDFNEIKRKIPLLKVQQLNMLRPRLQEFIESLPEDSGADGDFQRLSELIDEELDDDLFMDEDEAENKVKEMASKLASWFSECFRAWTEPLNGRSLAEVWYTGEAPFPYETINPSVRASVMAGLLRPKEFTSEVYRDGCKEDEDALWENSDTSILFNRYLDGGKMINIYDWFESFHAVLETQREKAKKKRMAAALEERERRRTITNAKVPQTPSKHNSPRKYGRSTNDKTPSKSKGKGKERERSPSPEPIEEDEDEDEEKWNMEVQARFIRALHELDFMGFVKHTKRKQDSVLRTVFDVSG